MAKSIMHQKDTGTCYLCMKLHGDYDRKSILHEHHVMYGGGRRALSEKYGLKIYLCLRHHVYDGGPEAVHRNNAVRRYTEAEAQRAFEAFYPNLVFKDIFGKNVVENAGRQQAYTKKAPVTGQEAAGFRLLETDKQVPPLEW